MRLLPWGSIWRCNVVLWMLCDTSFAFMERTHGRSGVLLATFTRRPAEKQQRTHSTSTSTAVPVSTQQEYDRSMPQQQQAEDSPISADELWEQIETAPESLRRETFHAVFAHALRHSKHQQMDELFQRMKQLPTSCSPTRVTYELMQSLWLSKHNQNNNMKDSATMWLSHLKDLRRRHDEMSSSDTTTQHELLWLPHKSTYLLTFKGLLQCRYQPNLLDDVHTLWEEMLEYGSSVPELQPDIQIANHVLMIWKQFGGQERCKPFLEQLEQLASEGGQPQLRPNRYSYCLVLDALAKSRQGNSAEQAEALLSQMKESGCEPDIIAYNAVLDAWARSKAPYAPLRAEATIHEMQTLFEEGKSNAPPDIVSYNTVLNALARSEKGFHESRRFLEQMEKQNVKPNVISYNILISALAEDPSVKNATGLALEILDKVRCMADAGDRSNCEPDCVTYTSVIKVMSKESDKWNPHFAEKAIALLEELEEKYDVSSDPALAPNARTYTSTISCISRSGVGPERAHAIVDRMEQRFLSGKSRARPDHICYNALVNAYGWSDMPGRALKCYHVFQHMRDQKGTMKPDIITCNSVLIACAHEATDSVEEREAILRAAIDVYEFFRTNAPQFGRLNHITFDRVLKVVARNLDDEWKRHSMAESIFAQCCLGGNVSVLVVSTLFGILPYDRLAELLGNALVSKKGDPLHFNWKLLPAEYTKYAPRPNRKSFSKGSHSKPHKREKPSEYRLRVKPNGTEIRGKEQ